MPNRPVLKLGRDQRKQRREARRELKKLAVERDVRKLKDAADKVRAKDPKAARHLEAKATRILHEDAARAVPSRAKPVDLRVALEAAAQRARAVAKASVIRRGTTVWRIDHTAIPPVWRASDYGSLNAAKHATGLYAVVLKSKEQLPSFVR